MKIIDVQCIIIVMSKAREYRRLILTLLLVGIIIFWGNLFNGETFAWYNDQAFQHNVFYQEWYRIIEETINNRTLSFYSWNTFLGTDFFVSKILYCVGDFLLTPLFVIIALLFQDININYDLLYTILTIVCIALSGITMRMFLKKFGIKNDNYLDIFSVIYALSGFVVTYSGTYMFHRFYALMPLLFYFTEEYIQRKRVAGFIIVVPVLFLQNYELMFCASLFLVLYFIFSSKLHYEKSIIEILKNSMYLIVSYIVGIMLCGFALLPIVHFLTSNPRLGSFSFGNVFWNYKTIVGFIINMICPSFNLRSDNPPYLFYNSEHFSAEYGIFATSLLLLGLYHLWKHGNQKEKKIFFVSEIIIFVFILIRPLNMIVHGFSEPTLRWSFLLMFFNILLSAYCLDRYNDNKISLKYCFVPGLSILILLIIHILIYNYDIKTYSLSILVILLSYTTIFVYRYLLNNNGYKLLFILTTINCSIFLGLMVNGKSAYQLTEPGLNVDNIEYQEQIDETKLFRYYFDPEIIRPFNYLNLNNSMIYNYRTVSTYDSTYDATVRDFLDANGYENWIIDISDSDLLRMLGVKYIGVLDDETLVKESDAEYYTNYNDIKIYKISNFNSIGHTYSNFVSDINEIKDWNSELYIKNEDIEKIAGIEASDKRQLVVEEYNRQYFKGNIDVDGKTVLFIAIPYSNGWNVYNQDGESIEKINVQGGFLGLIIDENDQELSFYYGTPGLKQGILLSGAGLLVYIAIIFIEGRKLRNNLL